MGMRTKESATEQDVIRLAIKKKMKDNRRKSVSQKDRDENIISWTTLYRRNVNLYVTDYLKMRIYPFQHLMLFLMNNSKVFFAICSRGLSKSFIVALFAMCKCMIYPYSGVVITATTIKQAEKMVREKMEGELCKKLSPIFSYYYKKGWIKFTYGKEETRVDFTFNNSFIIVAPSLDSSRGLRATVLIYEECRLLKKGIVDGVFEPMGSPRRANFLNQPEYNQETKESRELKARWLEEAQSIYITSAKFKSEWFWRTFLVAVNQAYGNRYERERQTFFCGDIFLALHHGIKTIPDYFKLKSQMSELDFRMEVLNEMIGEAEGAVFNRGLFKKNQIIKTAFNQPTADDIVCGNMLNNRPKIDGEKRLLFIDFAFSESISKNENDNSVVGCMSIVPKKDGGYERVVDFITKHQAGDSYGLDLKIRELYFDYEGDYIVIDQRNGGEVYFSDLSQKRDHPLRPQFNANTGIGWRDNGFTVTGEMKYHLVTQAKIDNLKKRAIDPDAIPCIIPITATPEQNSAIWLEMQKSLRNENISFLIDDMEYDLMFEETDEYFELSSEEKAVRKQPFNSTMEMINEAVNLSPIWNSGLLKVQEPRSGTKDMIVALAYGNYIATLIEQDLQQNKEATTFNVSSLASCLIW